MTATMLERSTAMQRRAPAVRRRIQRSKTLTEQFEELTDGYPFFGAIVGNRRYIVPGCLQNVALLIAQKFPTAPLFNQEIFQELLNRCETEHPDWFTKATALWMDRPSRELQAGINVFRGIRNFTQIPDVSVPASVVRAYASALVEGSRNRQFWYFEPIFNASTGTLVPTTIGEFNAMLNGQHEAIVRMVPKIRRALFVNSVIDPSLELATDIACIAAALPFIATWKTLCGITSLCATIGESIGINRALDIRAWAETRERYEAHRAGRFIHGGRREMTFQEALTTLARSPLARFSTEDLDRIVRLYDPIIAFSLRNLQGTPLRQQFRGKPLALVSHW